MTTLSLSVERLDTASHVIFYLKISFNQYSVVYSLSRNILHKLVAPCLAACSVLDSECRKIRRDCRRLERRYRQTKSNIDCTNFIAAQRHKHDSFVTKKNKYWTDRISAERVCRRNSGSRYPRYCGETRNWTVPRRLRRTAPISLSSSSATKSRHSARTRRTVCRRHLHFCGRPSHR